MKTVLCSLLIALASIASAQELDPDGPKVPRRPQIFPEEVVKPDKRFRMSNRVTFVVDVSGSMDDVKIRQAVDSCLLIIGTDDLRVSCYAFAGGFAHWKGVPWHARHDAFEDRGPRVQGLQRLNEGALRCGRDCVPEGWARVPLNLKEFLGWLNALTGKGLTHPELALEAAIEDPEAETVVLVTDGKFNPKETLRLIAKARAARKKAGLGPVWIMVWGVGPGKKAKTESALLRVAKVGGGGLWVHGDKRSGPW